MRLESMKIALGLAFVVAVCWCQAPTAGPNAETPDPEILKFAKLIQTPEGRPEVHNAIATVCDPPGDDQSRTACVKRATNVVKSVMQARILVAQTLTTTAQFVIAELGPRVPQVRAWATSRELARFLGDLAMVYHSANQDDKAESLFDEALNKAKALEQESMILADVMAGIGMFRDEQNKHDLAVEYLSRALEMTKKLRPADDPFTIDLEEQTALAYVNAGDFEHAEGLLLDALALRRKEAGTDTEGTSAMAALLNLLGANYIDSGDLQKAEGPLNEAVAIRRKLLGNTNVATANSIGNLGVLYMKQGRFDKAEPLVIEAAEIRKLADAKSLNTAAAVNNLAVLYSRKGDFEKAQQIYQDSLVILKQGFGESVLTARTIENLGLLHIKTGRLELATSELEDSRRIIREKQGPSHPNTASAAVNLANAYRAQGAYDKAEPLYQEGISINKRTRPDNPLTLHSLELLAGMYVAGERYADAERLYVEATAGRNRLISTSLMNLPEQGQRDFLGEFDGERDCAITNAIRLQSSAKMQELGAEANRLSKGLQLSAQQELFARLRRENGSQSEVLLNSMLALSHRISFLEGRAGQAELIARLRKEHDSIEEQLLKLDGYRAWKQFVTDADVRKQLPPGGALIDLAYFREIDFRQVPPRDVGPWHYAAFVYLPDRVETLDLGRADGIHELLNRELGMENRLWAGSRLNSAREILADLEASKTTSQALFNKLIAPIRQHLGEARFGAIKHWLISPDGELANLPWESLIDSSGHYLVESTLVSYVESPRTMVYRNTSTTSRPAVAFLDPQYDRTVKRLPAGRGTSISGGNVYKPLYQGNLARQFSQTNAAARLMTWQDATEDALFNLRQPASLLIWTHGIVFEKAKDPLERTHVVLAGVVQGESPTKDHDGNLTARKAMNLDLTGTGLAVVAGCNTGYGTVEAGEGLQGMRRALWVAGSKSQLLTLWPVADQHTVRWLELFYEELRKPGMTRAEAVSNVQKQFIGGKVKGLGEEQKHPYFWASFTLSGDWDR